MSCELVSSADSLPSMGSQALWLQSKSNWNIGMCTKRHKGLPKRFSHIESWLHITSYYNILELLEYIRIYYIYFSHPPSSVSPNTVELQIPLSFQAIRWWVFRAEQNARCPGGSVFPWKIVIFHCSNNARPSQVLCLPFSPAMSPAVHEQIEQNFGHWITFPVTRSLWDVPNFWSVTEGDIMRYPEALTSDLVRQLSDSYLQPIIKITASRSVMLATLISRYSSEGREGSISQTPNWWVERRNKKTDSNIGSMQSARYYL